MESLHQMLLNTVERLYRRKAYSSLKKVFEKSHGVDIAGVLSSVSYEVAEKLFKLIHDEEKKAEILSHLESEKQKKFINFFSQKELIQIVGLMDSDDAADFLSNLSNEESEVILKKMVPQDSQGVAELMVHSSDSAGGLMTTDFLSLNQNLLVSEAIKKIQSHQDKVLFYIYIVNDHNNLAGVLSLKQLLLCPQKKSLKEIMLCDVISVHVTDTQSKVAEIVERYDFLALPVVNVHNQLEGVITVDDVIDVIREEAEEQFLSMGQSSRSESFWLNLWKRLSLLFYSFFSGFLCFITIYNLPSLKFYNFQIPQIPLWSEISFFPMLWIMGLTVANQSAATSITILKDLELKKIKWLYFFSSEILMNLFVLFFLGSLTWSFFWFLSLPSGYLIMNLILEILTATFLGSSMPILIQKLKGSPSLTTIPTLTVLVTIFTLLLYMWFLGKN